MSPKTPARGTIVLAMGNGLGDLLLAMRQNATNGRVAMSGPTLPENGDMPRSN